MIAARSSLAQGLATHDIILHRTGLVSTCRIDCRCYSGYILDTRKEDEPTCREQFSQASTQPVVLIWQPSMSIIKSFLGILALLFLIILLLLVAAIVTGSLLRLVFPSVDRGMSIIIGLVATVASVQLITRFSMDLRPGPINLGSREFHEDDDDDDEDEEGDPPHRPPTWTLPPPERPSWKRRRRRR